MAYEIPYDSNYGEWYGTPQDVTRLSAILEQSLDEDGYPIGIITASWNMPDNGGTFVAQLSTDGENYHIAETNIRQNSVVLVVEPNTDYYLKIITVLGSQQSSGVVSSLLSSSVTIVPPTPTVVAVQGGMQINVGSVPFGYNAVISISDGTDTTVLYTTNMITIYNCDAGTYSVSTAYSNASNDVGASSSAVSVTVSELATADDYVEKTSADYIKGASVSNDTLTLTKGDNSTVTFQGGGYILPIASANVLGGIKVGNNLSIDENGVLSAIGGGGSGGVTIDKLYSGNSTALSVGDELNLSHTWKDYDFIEFGVFPNGAYLTSSNPYGVPHIISAKSIQDCYTANNNMRLGISVQSQGSTERYVSLRIFDTKFMVNTTNANSKVCIEYIHGIKISGGGSGGGSYTAGDGIDITNDVISLDVASANGIGGIKVGSGLSIDANGVLSATGMGGGFASIDTSNLISNIYDSMSSWTNGAGTRVTYTATENCYICGTFTGIIGGGGTPSMDLGLDVYINNAFIQKIYSNVNGTSMMYPINLPLASGDTIKFEAKGSNIGTKGYLNAYGVKYT